MRTGQLIWRTFNGEIETFILGNPETIPRSESISFLVCLSGYIVQSNIREKQEKKSGDCAIYTRKVKRNKARIHVRVALHCVNTYITNDRNDKITYAPSKNSGLEVIKLFFSCSIQLSMKFSLLINMKTPTIVGIFIFISRENFMLSYV